MEQNRKMTIEEILGWYEKIRPINWFDGQRFFCKKLTKKQVMEEDYRYIIHGLGETPEIVESGLDFLTDVKMLHPLGPGAGLTATVADIICQIPEEFLEKTIAFEMVYNDYSKYQRKIFQNEWNDGFYVSVVRLYQATDESKNTALKSGIYPEDFAPVPIGMTEEQLRRIKEVAEYTFQRGLY